MPSETSENQTSQKSVTCYGVDLGGGQQSHEPTEMAEAQGGDGPTLRCPKCGVRVDAC